MANLPTDFRDKVDRLERNFAVSTVIFKKYEPIFLDIFKNPANDPPKQNRSRKQRRLPCTVSDLFDFCWSMFVQVKGNFPAISDDLVNSYHLLLCCIDWFYTNALLGNRRDLLNPTFSALPESYSSKDYKVPTEVPCIIQLLCEKHEGITLEAKGIKEHWWKPHIKKLFDKKFLKGKVENLTGILEVGHFEANSKAIRSAYEEYVLNVGDFDERIFVGDDATTEIGTPAKSAQPMADDLSERMQIKQHLQTFDQNQSLCPDTPLTGRRYLKEKDTSDVTPVSTATQGVHRLQALLSGRKTSPSEELMSIFEECSVNPKDTVVQRVKKMGEIFCTHYAQPSENHPGSHIDFARKRLQLGESLYFKTLENIMVYEKRRILASHRDSTGRCDFAYLLEQDVFHQCLFACCLEIVIFSYNSQRSFPWIMEVFDLQAYDFYKVIEVLIRTEDGLSRDVVKHLNHVEETILESQAWKYGSTIWTAIKEQGDVVPSCEQVTLPSQIDKGDASASVSSSPLIHPTVKRLAGEGRAAFVRSDSAKKDPMMSPTGPSATDRFGSPTPGGAKRRLFGQQGGEQQTIVVTAPGSASGGTDTAEGQGQAPKPMTMYHQAQTQDGRQVLIPVQIIAAGASGSTVAGLAKGSTPSKPQNKPKRGGSLGLFFRKVYHLASTRLRHLCEQLGIESELRQKIWTLFEHTLIKHIDLMMDRHIDQLLMCATYVMCKVTGDTQSFQDIMKCYRLQPQSQSHVYRSVLVNNRRRHHSGSSDSSRNGASGTSSPVDQSKEEREKQEKKRAERLAMIRSTSTLPPSHENSQPPTPTRLAGTGSSFEFEERGDLIKFYNTIFVKRVRSYAVKFTTGKEEKNDAPMLSPLPLHRTQPTSPRRVSNNHSLYISPHKTSGEPQTPTSRLLWCFNKSPAKDLKAINNMLRLGERKITAGKRLHLRDEDSSSDNPTKKMNLGNSIIFSQKLQAVNSDRLKGANGTGGT
ncbi:unnamed protein product [Owenia fusiformis]|nr:unnamed protein product [Owenia fusiformis]